MGNIRLSEVIPREKFFNDKRPSGKPLEIFLEDLGFCRTADLTEEEERRLDEVEAWEDDHDYNGWGGFDKEKGTIVVNGEEMPKDLYEDGERIRDKMYEGFEYLQPGYPEESIKVVERFGDREFETPIPKGAKMYFTYPLSCCAVMETTEELKKPSDFVRAFCDAYQMIYDMEDGTSDIKADNIPGMYNRNRTNGCFGIWGHEIGDLVLEDVSFDDGGNTITFIVGS